MISALLLAALLQTGYTVSGTVVRGASNDPVGKARVFLVPSNGSRGQAMITGGDGRFHFDALPAGKYMITVERLGFVQQSYKERALYQELATGVAVGDGLSGENLIFRMIPSSVVTGIVTDTQGEPVVGLNVLVMRVVGAGAQRRVLRTQTGRTDDRGSYRVHSLAAGTYLVAMYGEGGLSLKEAERTLVYPVTYYPGATDPAGAQVIRLDAGREVRCDVMVQAKPAGTLIGDVNFVGGHQLSISVSAIGPFGNRFDIGRRTNTRHLGNVTMNLPPARYAMYLWNDQRIAGYKVVDVVPGSETRVSIGETPLAKVTANVQVRGGSAAGPMVLVLRHPGTPEGDSKTVNADGQALFPSIAPGVYEVYVTNGRTLAMVSFTARGAVTTGSVVEIGESGEVELNVVADASAADVTGIAYRGDKREAGLLMMLVPKLGWENTSTYRFDQSDSDGTFAWHNVPRGEYLMFAFDEGEPADYLDPALWRSLVTKGQPLTVSGARQEPVKVTIQ